jgi:hypothetical protein
MMFIEDVATFAAKHAWQERASLFSFMKDLYRIARGGRLTFIVFGAGSVRKTKFGHM